MGKLTVFIFLSMLVFFDAGYCEIIVFDDEMNEIGELLSMNRVMLDRFDPSEGGQSPIVPPDSYIDVYNKKMDRFFTLVISSNISAASPDNVIVKHQKIYYNSSNCSGDGYSFLSIPNYVFVNNDIFSDLPLKMYETFGMLESLFVGSYKETQGTACYRLDSNIKFTGLKVRPYIAELIFKVPTSFNYKNQNKSTAVIPLNY